MVLVGVIVFVLLQRKTATNSLRVTMRDELKISVITPSLNQGEFLEHAILSILNQDYNNIESIVIDGGSEDNSVALLKKHDKRIAYWVSETDYGEADAANKGLARVTGDIVGYLNSDDMYYSDQVFKAIAKWFKENPESNVCYGSNLYLNEKNEILFFRRAYPVFSKWLFQRWDFVHHPTVFFRSHLLTKCRFKEELHYIMDYDFLLQLAQHGKFGHINDIVCASRWYSTNKTILEPQGFIYELKALKKQGSYYRGVYFIQKVLYNLLRLYSIVFIRDVFSNISKSSCFLKINYMRLFLRQIFGLRVDRLFISKGQSN